MAFLSNVHNVLSLFPPKNKALSYEATGSKQLRDTVYGKIIFAELNT
jgi:hypothetical protein